MSPVFLVGAAIVLFGFGLAAGFLFAAWRNKGEASKASEIQTELDDYRRQVTEHFGETAQQFQAIGEQYRSLYKHMAAGATTLCDPAEADNLLDFSKSEIPAIEARSVDEPVTSPEGIKDYAVVDDIDAGDDQARQDPEPVDQAGGDESLSEASASDKVQASEPEAGETLAETAKEKESSGKPAEEVLKDKVSAAIPVEPDRTVH